MLKSLLTAVFILCFIHSNAQIGSEYKNRRIRSAEQIKSLKQGALFFRLRTRDNQVEYLRKYGRYDEADKIEQKRFNMNVNIIDAFNQYFSFCPVYFFYSKDSKYVRQAQFDSLVFLDSGLVANPAIRPNPTYYCTAEFGTVKADTARFYGGTKIVEGEDGLEERPVYTTGPDAGFKAIIIQSDQFIQLVKPFPFYQRTFTATPNRKRIMGFARKLNAALFEYFDTV